MICEWCVFAPEGDGMRRKSGWSPDQKTQNVYESNMFIIKYFKRDPPRQLMVFHTNNLIVAVVCMLCICSFLMCCGKLSKHVFYLVV